MPLSDVGSQIASELSAAFAHRFGGAPEGVWSAPGRVNLIGEHTDYNQGLCLPIGLPQRTYVAARVRDDRRLRLWSAQADAEAVEVDLDQVRPGHPGGWAAYAAGAVWALAGWEGLAGQQVSGLDLAVDGRVPLGAGLSSSAALSCSVGAAAAQLAGVGLLDTDSGRAILAGLCVRAENEIALAPTGGMDQSAALRCRSDHALMLDCRDGSVRQVPFDLTGHGLVLLVMDTRAHHELTDGQYGSRRRECEESAQRLGVTSLREVPPEGLADALSALSTEVLRRRTTHIVTEIERVRQTVDRLLEEDYTQVGRLFDASHTSMRDDFQISCVELDLAVDTARTAGALGARMTGGGFGGSAIALLPTDRVEAASAAVEQAFAAQGYRSPVCFPVTAGPPAARES